MKKYIFIIPVLITMIFLFSSHAFGTTTYTQRPPNNLSREPFFRIETGMHTSPARQIAVDAENRYIVTGSDDKTVRIWESATGNLLRILRPPIGEQYEGNIYAVAISPDGGTVACAGWTMGGDIFHNIYLFDRESGRMKGRIPDIINVVRHLRYSKDGRYLAATLGGSNGFRVFDVSGNRLAGEDKEYGGDSFSADFDAKNRLITVSYDGFARLYDSTFKILTKARLTGGNKPYSVSFSPDGSKVAVGFHDSTKIDVLSGADLTYLYSPDAKSAEKGNLEVVAWSTDGKYLYGGGRFQHEGKFPIFKWSGEGRGSSSSLEGIENSIADIVPLKDGGICYASADPAFGIFDRNDRRTIYRTPSIGDFRNRGAVLMSDNGFTVQFEYDAIEKASGIFSVSEKLLEIVKQGDEKQRAYDKFQHIKETAESLGITNWEDSYKTALKGVPVKLNQHEFSRSIAVSPGKNAFLLGTSWNLRFFDISGTEKWRTPVHSTPWAVDISKDGRVAIAALGDGTIRWYRLSDGKNILNLFPHKDKKKWVLWTPAGYYDASAGAEELIGWHVNNSPDMASDFFSISRFRNRYYRPDVIEKVMERLDEKESVNLVNQESGRRRQEEEVSVKKILPPVVSIVSPFDNTTVSNNNILVRFTVRSPSEEPLTEIKALVNGRPVATTRDMVFEEVDPKRTGILEQVKQEQGIGLKADKTSSGQENVMAVQAPKESPAQGSTKQVTVMIPNEDAQISIIASNKFTASEPATVKLKWQGMMRKDEFTYLPKLYILAIGVGKYVNFPPENQLKFAAKDARDFVEAMQDQKGKLYRDIGVRLLVDDTATRDNILDGLEWIQRATTSKDVAMVFLSGHGVNDNTGVYYFVPTNFDKRSIKRTGVPYGDIKNTVANLAGKTIVFVDTCHSGNVMGTRKALGDVTSIANELASAENGAVVFASSTGRQFSLERPEWNNGAFTKALVEGLSGRADYTRKGKVSINMLDLYLSERVKELTDGQQTPTTTKPQTIQDFPVAVVK